MKIRRKCFTDTRASCLRSLHLFSGASQVGTDTEDSEGGRLME